MSDFTQYLNMAEKGSIFLEDTTPDEVLDIIKEFDNNNKSSDIPIVVIKHCAPTLSKLYNNCMSRGTFPDELKLGVITPIHKKGPKDDVGNYRPISTFPIFGKIFEKILYSRIYSFMSQRNLICDTQFGFRQNHSTSHAIHHSINFIKGSHMLNKHVIGIFIDLSKAFDTIDHKKLLYKLYNYGIRGLAYNLIKSYLSNRYQCVKIEDQKSENVLVKYGVPQGSVLGPLLFLLYINDLKNIITHKNCKIILYADDTNIFIAFDTISNATQLSNDVLLRIQGYMYANLLHINIDKSCCMYFPPNRKYINFSNAKPKKNKGKGSTSDPAIEKMGIEIYLGSASLKEVTETRFLGVIFDPTLDWNAHIKSLLKKLKTSFAIIKRISSYIPPENHKDIYHTLFESHLSYCISVRGGTKKKLIDRIFTLQKSAIRYLFGDYESFLDKFNTAARTRPFGEQCLSANSYCKEHTK